MPKYVWIVAFAIASLPFAHAGPQQRLLDVEERVQSLLGSRSYLGVGVAEIDSERVKALKLPEERGVEITKVDPGSPAEKGGLQAGDVVLEYNGQRVEGLEQFIRMVRETPPGRTARVTASRQGVTQNLTVTIGERRPADLTRGMTIRVPPVPPVPPIPPLDVPKPLMTVRTTRVGLETESLSDQLAEFFGVKQGVLVRSVERNSPAEKAGLRAGDVIISIDGQEIRAARDISRRLRESWEKKTVPLQVVRNKKELTLHLELPEQERGERRLLVMPVVWC
jgi:serine protease Do